MLHFVKQFKRKKTTFENFFVQKTNAEYTVTDNAQEAFPEKPCGSAVKAVVPCLLKINLHFSKPHLRKTAVENGQRTMHKRLLTKIFSHTKYPSQKVNAGENKQVRRVVRQPIKYIKLVNFYFYEKLIITNFVYSIFYIFSIDIDIQSCIIIIDKRINHSFI